MRPTIFHEPWWLDAAAGDKWREVRVETGSGQAAAIPVFQTTKRGVSMLGMGPFTQILGPYFEGVSGKPEAQRRMRLFLIDELIRKLPPHMIFNQVFAQTPDLGLPWRVNGYTATIEYTFVLENCSDLAAVRAGMRDKIRNVLRRAEETQKVELNAITAAEFVNFYFDNLASRGRRPDHKPSEYRHLIETAIQHGAAQILSARRGDGTLLASICTVFDAHTTYYLFTTQNRAVKDTGSAALLIWNAIKQAGERGQAFDFDGFRDRESMAFTSQFGGELRSRLRITRMPKILQSILHLGPRFSPGSHG